jgi:hypothetical protein
LSKGEVVEEEVETGDRKKDEWDESVLGPEEERRLASLGRTLCVLLFLVKGYPAGGRAKL